MTAVDDLISDLQRGRYSEADQNLIAVVNTAVAALQQIQAGLSPPGVEQANFVYAGPISGGAALPAFRAPVIADIQPAFLAELGIVANPDFGYIFLNRGQIHFPVDGDFLIQNFAGTARANVLCRQVQPDSVQGIRGTTTNDNAAAGVVGEYITAQVQRAGAIAAVNGVTLNAISIALTAGDWDITGLAAMAAAAGNITSMQTCINTVSATLTTFPNSGLAALSQGLAVVGDWTQNVAGRLSLAAPATAFLVCNGTFAAGNGTVYGAISARRAR